MVILVILLHGLSLTLHVYEFLFLKGFRQLQLKTPKSTKEKAIYFITNKDMRVFLVRYMFLKVLLCF